MSALPAEPADRVGEGWLDGEAQAVWRRLLAVHAALVEALDQDLTAAHELSLGEYEVLVHLSEAPDLSLRMSELAALISLSPSGLTRRVDRLVQRGLVRRVPCASDGRGSYASLTGSGLERLRSAAPTHVAGVRRYLVDALGPDGISALSTGLTPVERALSERRALAR